jgi:hypothetical protein
MMLRVIWEPREAHDPGTPFRMALSAKDPYTNAAEILNVRKGDLVEAADERAKALLAMRDFGGAPIFEEVR